MSKKTLSKLIQIAHRVLHVLCLHADSAFVELLQGGLLLSQPGHALGPVDPHSSFVACNGLSSYDVSII